MFILITLQIDLKHPVIMWKTQNVQNVENFKFNEKLNLVPKTFLMFIF